MQANYAAIPGIFRYIFEYLDISYEKFLYHVIPGVVEPLCEGRTRTEQRGNGLPQQYEQDLPTQYYQRPEGYTLGDISRSREFLLRLFLF